MGILDSAFGNLPKVASDIGNSVVGQASNAVSFLTANASTKISEAASSIYNTVGSEGGPFSKIGANLPSFDSLKSAAMKAGSTLLGGTGQLVSQQIASDASRLAGTFSARQTKEGMAPTDLTSHLFTLSEVGGGERVVVFDVMPEVVEARTVQYEAVAPAQFPGAFQKYKGTDSTQWTLNVTFIARTTKEATQNLYYINTLRGWTMPFFGSHTSEMYKNQLGAPPPVLKLKGLRNVVGEVPVVITSLNWNWPKDVDYLPTSWGMNDDDSGEMLPFPAVMNVAIQLVESFSTSQFNMFSLIDFRHGNMNKAFNTTLGIAPPSTSVLNSAPDNTQVATQADVRRIDNAIEAKAVPVATQASVRAIDNATVGLQNNETIAANTNRSVLAGVQSSVRAGDRVLTRAERIAQRAPGTKP